MKLDAVHELMELYIKRQKWQEAVDLAKDKANKGKFDSSIFVPYAEWLALNDRFDEALAAYRQAGRPDQSRRMMEQLTFNAVVERRFKDAAYYYWLLANEVIKPVEKQSQPQPTDAGAPLAGKVRETAANTKPKRRGRGGNGIAESKDAPAFTDPDTQASACKGLAETKADVNRSGAFVEGFVDWPGVNEATLHKEYLRRAEIYYAYQHIENLQQPFSPSHAEANFQVITCL